MWIGTASLKQLHSRSCWKVEFFCETTHDPSSAAFPFVKLETLVAERKEMLDPQARPNELLNYIGLENVESITGNLIDFKPRYGKEIRSRSKVFYAGDILYGRLRPYLNKVFLPEEPLANGICSGEFYVLVPNRKKVLPHFLRALLTSSYVQQFAARWQTGSALPRLQLHDLLSIEVPLPPIEAQGAFENFLMAQTLYQRRLAAELTNLPQRILSTLTMALETGDEALLSQSNSL